MHRYISDIPVSFFNWKVLEFESAYEQKWNKYVTHVRAEKSDIRLHELKILIPSINLNYQILK